MLWFTLALRLGSTVYNLKKTMSQHEFSQWVTYNQLQPIGDIRNDYNAARVSFTSAAVAGNKKIKIEDFVNFKTKTPHDYKLEKLDPLELEIYHAFNTASK